MQAVKRKVQQGLRRFEDPNLVLLWDLLNQMLSDMQLMFPEEKKREQREKQFPIDLNKAYELGKNLTEKAKEEGYNE